jgi:HEAT repeat protein
VAEAQAFLARAAACETLDQLRAFKPAQIIDAIVAVWRVRPARDLLDELATLPPMADEDDRCWNTAAYWMTVAYPYVAFADLAAERLLRPAIRLLLDRACFGDPGEIMRGLRHALEAIVDLDWTALADDCLAAIQTARPGTVLWATEQLAILDDPRARPIFEELVRSPHERIREAAAIGLDRLD